MVKFVDTSGYTLHISTNLLTRYCKEVLDFPIIEYHISFLSPIFHVRSDTLATNLGTQVH